MKKESELKIIKFEKRSTVQTDVVDVLEKLLVRAKEGDIVGVYCAGVCGNDDILTVYSSTTKLFTALGAIAHLQQRLLNEIERE